MASIRINICCDGVKPIIKRRGIRLVRYRVMCPRCYETGPERFGKESADKAWNKRVKE